MNQFGIDISVSTSTYRYSCSRAQTLETLFNYFQFLIPSTHSITSFRFFFFFHLYFIACFNFFLLLRCFPQAAQNI